MNQREATGKKDALQETHEERLLRLERELAWTRRKYEALRSSSRSVHRFDNFRETAESIFYTCSELLGSTAGYVALLSDDGRENEVLFLEAGGRPCTVPHELPMPIRGLRAESYRDNKVVFDNDFMHSKWVKLMPEGHVDLDNVLFSPLVIDGQTVGIIGLANKPGGFTREDAEVALLFGDLAAIALRNSKQLQDIRDKETTEKHLRHVAEQASLAKSKFLANMSHEIRTPMNGVLGMLQLLANTQLTTDQTEFLTLAMESSKKLTNLLSDIIDLSRIEAGRIEIESRPFNLRELVREIETLLTQTAHEKGLMLLTYLNPDVPAMLQGDAAKLRQVLLNIMSNAVKYTAQGEVRFEAHPLYQGKTLQRILFIVSDTGIGISDGAIDTIFDMFTQADGSYSRRYQGAGLGLSIVRQLLRHMNGNMAVESDEGQGSTFFISLPMQAASQETRPVFRPESPIRFASAPRILIVEDDYVNRFTLKQMLDCLGMETEEAIDGHEAIEKIKSSSYDLVLMDIQMPNLNGVETTRIIRSHPAIVNGHDIPIVALTAHAMSGDRERFLEAGMDGYMSKPVEMKDLERMIAGFLSGKP